MVSAIVGSDYMHAAGRGGECSGACSRGVQQGSVHQGTIIAILDQIVHFAGHVAVLRLVGSRDTDGVFGVVEINDLNVKDQHSRAGNEVLYSGR